MARGWKIFKKKRILKAEKWIEEGNVIGCQAILRRYLTLAIISLK